MEERRHNPRTHVDWRVKLAAAGQDLCNGYLTNVSPVGATIMCPAEYQAGSQIVIHFGAFDGNNDQSFSLVAVIRHAGKGRLGIEFIDGPVTDQDRLHYLLRGVFRTG